MICRAYFGELSEERKADWKCEDDRSGSGQKWSLLLSGENAYESEKTGYSLFTIGS